MVIVVEIEDRCAAKPFLGGWRNVVTGTEYHDADAQTCPGDRVYRGSKEDSGGSGAVPRVIRTANVITQTHGNRDGRETFHGVSGSCCKYTSVSTGRATQTSRLPDLRDKLVTPLAVTGIRNRSTRGFRHRKTSVATSFETQRRGRENGDTADDEENRFSRLEEECAVKIQKCYRAHRARVDIGALAKLSRETRAQTPPEPEKVQSLRHCPTTQFEIVNATSPNRRSDFEMVENVLGRWRVSENHRIDRSFFGATKLAARTKALFREIEILRSIDAIKTRVRLERRQRRYLDRLDELAQSEIWIAGDGKKIHVDTLRVQRARECRDFYAALSRENVGVDERTEALKNLQRYATRHSCRLASDLSSLVDQELELLAHDVDPRAMVSLRNRSKLALLRLSLNMCESRTTTNEKILNATIIHRSSRGNKSFSKLCNGCGKFLNLDDISRFTTRRGLVVCENCENSRPGGEPRVVYEPYELMLRELRSRESRSAGEQPATSGIPAFAVDPRVIYRLVNYVWHGKSGISECDDLFRLELVRFRAELEWSPWNNLVLTKREAALHRAMPDPLLIYSSSLVKKFVVKNLQAKLRFNFLTKCQFYS